MVRDELLEVREAYGDARRTEINRDHLDLTTEDLIEPQDVVVTLSHAGYAKSQPLTEYQTQRRGGRGKTATAVKDEDFVEKLFVAHTHDTVLCFSNRGKVYWLKVYELPQAGRGSRGKPMVNLLPLEEGEKINALLPVKQYDEQHFVFMATRAGTVKKTPLAAFSRPAHQRASSRWTWPTTTSWWAWRSPTASARSSWSPAAARRSASTRAKCAPWAARPPACAASAWARGRS